MLRCGLGVGCLVLATLFTGLASAASPQVAAAHAFRRDATQLRRTLESACGGSPVVRSACELESAAARLVERMEGPRCQVEVPLVLNECIVIYKGIDAHVGADYRLASNPQIAAAVACTGRHLTAVIEALRKYQAAPAPLPYSSHRIPTWNDQSHFHGPLNLDPRDVFGSHGSDPRFNDPRYADPRYDAPRYSVPRYNDPRYSDPRYFVPEPTVPNYPPTSRLAPSNPDFERFGRSPSGLGPTPFPVPISRSGNQPRLGQAILEAVLSEVLR